jgi:uncharacterized damage-inducible protein DinB
MATETIAQTLVLTPEQLLTHWQGHRALTRRVIEAFPEGELFKFSIGGMRPFSDLTLEMIHMAAPSLKGLATGQWAFASSSEKPTTRAVLLSLWDDTTAEIDRLWPTIPVRRFQEIDKAFGQWEMPGYGLLLYVVDNEIHHRAQGYVYLRALGIEPPPFYHRT